MALVRAVLAELLQRRPDQIRPNATLSELGADELDLVEAVMELEDRLKISISDESLEEFAGTARPEQLLHELTIEEFAAVVTATRGGRGK